MKVFICGIIQGSLRGLEIHTQSYREIIHAILKRHIPHIEIYCPVTLHPHSPNYNDRKAAEVLEQSIEEAKRSDLLVAYLPEASMGSAIEMWEAKKVGVPIVAITPLKTNWVIRYTADKIFETLDEFEQWVRESGITKTARQA